MDETTKIIRDYYDAGVEGEWNRIAGRPEFLLTCRFLDRYIHPGDKVLDIGGGPGRYSLYLAEKGCDVTLFDLSGENVRFALERARERSVPLRAAAGDARAVDGVLTGQFDHILLMGPMYHLLEEADRVRAVKAALRLLKPGGVIFVSFINLVAGIIYEMKIDPACRISTVPGDMEYSRCFLAGKSFAGTAFTEAFFIAQREILPFMAQFPLAKLHLFGQESILSPCEGNIMGQPPEVIDAWLDFAEKICEREDLLSWSEHLMYVGRYLGW